MLHLILDIKEGKKVKIVIIGDGKVGHKLTAQLSEEDYDVVLIDQNEGKLKSDEDDYALLAEIILLIALRKYMSTNRAVEIAQDIETIVPYVSELKLL